MHDGATGTPTYDAQLSLIRQASATPRVSISSLHINSVLDHAYRYFKILTL